MSWSWSERGIDQLAILRRDVERSKAMRATNPYTNWNTWDGKNSSGWWAVAAIASDRGDTVARDEAIQVARALAEADAITERFENLPIVRRYRAEQAKEQEAPVPT